MTTLEKRASIDKEAREWIGTPYEHNQHVKGAGACCAWFIADVYNRAIGANLSVVNYPEQWYMNEKYIKEGEFYINNLLKLGFFETDRREKGNLVLSKIDQHLYCHAGIILEWPLVIHVCGRRGVQIAKSLYSSWYFGQDPDSLKIFEWRGLTE